MSKRYFARENWPITDHDAQVIGSCLEQSFNDGEITPEKIVELATSELSPIHKYFEWDDQVAAHKYRVDQARQYLKAIAVEIKGSEVPAFHRVYLKNHHAYISAERAIESEQLWKQVIRQALKEAKGWAARYRGYQQLNPIIDSIESVEREVLHEGEETQRTAG